MLTMAPRIKAQSADNLTDVVKRHGVPEAEDAWQDLQRN